MSANRRRGEVGAELDGRDFTLCLTLGALAELEDACGVEDIGALVARLAGGKLSARDVVRVIGAGLRGAGNAVTDEQVMAMRAADGAAGFVRIVAELLAATFGPAKQDGQPDTAGPAQNP